MPLTPVARLETWADHKDWSGAEFSIANGDNTPTIFISDGVINEEYIPWL